MTTVATRTALRRRLVKESDIMKAALMTRWNCSRSMVTMVLNGTTRSYDKELDLAEMLGVKHEDIYPKPTSIRSRKVVSL